MKSIIYLLVIIWQVISKLYINFSKCAICYSKLPLNVLLSEKFWNRKMCLVRILVQMNTSNFFRFLICSPCFNCVWRTSKYQKFTLPTFREYFFMTPLIWVHSDNIKYIYVSKLYLKEQYKMSCRGQVEILLTCINLTKGGVGNGEPDHSLPQISRHV